VTYKTGGLTGVLTFPDFASTGHGTRVVEAATKYIAEAGADIGLTTCEPALRFFYARAGWIPLTNTTLLFGDVTSPVAVDELVLMLFVSEKAKRGRQSFEGRRVYVGANTW
jgi:aminoglycoside 2'-N-acetyltransferase I